MKLVSWFVIGFVLLLMGGGIYIYLDVISPAFVKKPVLEKPTVLADVQEVAAGQEPIVEEKHLQYVVNELGGYKLHEDPLTDEPAVMELHVTDRGAYYTVTVTDNIPYVEQGKASNPDLRLHLDQITVMALLDADDFAAEVFRLVEEDKIWIELLADEKTLALKGYKGVYDTISQDAGMPTGDVVRVFDGRLIRVD